LQNFARLQVIFAGMDYLCQQLHGVLVLELPSRRARGIDVPEVGPNLSIVDAPDRHGLWHTHHVFAVVAHNLRPTDEYGQSTLAAQRTIRPARASLPSMLASTLLASRTPPVVREPVSGEDWLMISHLPTADADPCAMAADASSASQRRGARASCYRLQLRGRPGQQQLRYAAGNLIIVRPQRHFLQRSLIRGAEVDLVSLMHPVTVGAQHLGYQFVECVH
jgi:hypothetical protein